MSNFSDFVGGSGGGGGGTTYNASSSEVAEGSITQGKVYPLDNTGKIYPTTPYVSDFSFQMADLAVASLSSSNISGHYQTVFNNTTRHDSPIMPNGNRVQIVRTTSGTSPTQYNGYTVTIFDTEGNMIGPGKYIGTDNQAYSGGGCSINYLGEDADSYKFGVMLWAIGAGISSHKLFYGLLTVSKAYPGYTSWYQAPGYNWLSNGWYMSNRENSIDFARGDSVWLMINGGEGSVHYTRFQSGTSSPTMSAVVTNSNIQTGYNTSSHTYSTGSIFKVGDADGEFIYFSNSISNNDGIYGKKITVAADGSHTITDLGSMALNNGLKKQGFAVHEDSGTGNFIFSYAPNNSSLVIQKATYTGGSGFDWVGTAKTITLPAAARFQNITRNWWRNSENVLFHNDKFFITPGQAYNSGSSSWGATGFIIDVTTDITIQSSIANRFYGGKAQADGSFYFIEANNEIGSVLPYGLIGGEILTSPVAMALESGVAGETINTALIGGISSASALPSDGYLAKDALYFPYTHNEISDVPSFYFSTESFVSLQTTVYNGYTAGLVFEVNAPDGKVLDIYELYQSAGIDGMDITVDGTKIISNGYIGNNSTSYISAGGLRIDKDIRFYCKSFKVEYDGHDTTQSNVYLKYNVGEFK